MYDVIVVGAGPAGSVTAHELARGGLSVLVIEKETFPRLKPCGGGLPVHATDLLDEIGIDIEPVVEDVARDVKFLYESKEPVRSDLSDAPVTMVNRADFDQRLIDQAIDEGVTFRDGTGVADVRLNDHCEVTLEDGTVETSRFVVGADGANSLVGRSLGLFETQTCGVALDAEVDVGQGAYEREKHQATFNVNFVENGYGWIFPKDNYLAMGVGGYDKDISYPQALQSFLEDSLQEGEIQDYEVLGHPLPYFDGAVTVTKGPVALVGDAAFMVDALSGEGIFYGMKAGTLLAESILEADRKNKETLEGYQQRLSETVFEELQWSSRLASVFFSYPYKCYNQGVKRPEIVNWIKQVVVSESSYDEIYGQIWDEIRRRTGSMFLRKLGLK
ncbi:MAG: NAD(P)/FAD-dependent oxidoreductase [bacterium]